MARSEEWKEVLDRSIKKTKEVFPDLELSVEFRSYDTGQTGAKEAGYQAGMKGGLKDAE